MAVLAPSLVSLRAQLNAISPLREKKHDGWIGDSAHSSRVSDHNPDHQGIVRAIDITDDTDGKGTDLDAWWLREALRSSEDPRIKYVISEGQMFSSYRTSAHAAWAWRPYNGPNGHFQHVHVSVKAGDEGVRAGMWNLSRDFAGPVRPSHPISPVEDEQMTPEQESRILERLDKVLWLAEQTKPNVDRLPKVQAGVDLANAGIGNVTNGLLTLLARNQGSALTAADIAAAIPQNLAAAVADELARRIKE